MGRLLPAPFHHHLLHDPTAMALQKPARFIHGENPSATGSPQDGEPDNLRYL